MKIKHGGNRLVVVIPELGIAVKLPKFYLYGFFSALFNKHKNPYEEVKFHLENFSYETYWSIQWCLAKGCFRHTHFALFLTPHLELGHLGHSVLNYYNNDSIF